MGLATHLAVWKKTDAVVLIHKSELSVFVEFENNFLYNLFELGPESDFEIIGEL